MMNLCWKECASLFTCWDDKSCMLSFRAVFITEFCLGRLPQVAVIKQIVQLYLFITTLPHREI